MIEITDIVEIAIELTGLFFIFKAGSLFLKKINNIEEELEKLHPVGLMYRTAGVMAFLMKIQNKEEISYDFSTTIGEIRGKYKMCMTKIEDEEND